MLDTIYKHMEEVESLRTMSKEAAQLIEETNRANNALKEKMGKLLGIELFLTHLQFCLVSVFIILVLFLIVSHSALPFSSVYILSDLFCYTVILFSVLRF